MMDLQPKIADLPLAKRETMENALRHIENVRAICMVIGEQLTLTRSLTDLLKEYANLRASKASSL